MTATGSRRMHPWKLAPLGALTAMTVILLATPMTSRAALPDANCPGPGGASFGSSGNTRLAQTFAAQTTGSLVRAEAPVNKSGTPGGDWVMQIVDTDAAGVPLNAVLASTAIPDATVPAGDSTLTGAFAPGATVVAGHQYALVVSRPGASKFNWDERSGDPCPGRQFESTSQTGPFLAIPPGFDFVFAVFVDPPNDFSIGKLKGRRLSLTVPGPGSVDVQDAAGTGTQARAAAEKKLLKSSRATASGAGTIEVALKLTKRAKRTLALRHKLKVKAAVTFTPTGGTAKTQTTRLKLKKK